MQWTTLSGPDIGVFTLFGQTWPQNLRAPASGSWYFPSAVSVATSPSIPLSKNCQWCGLRLSVLEQDRCRTKKMVLVLQVWCYGLVTLVVVMILKDTASTIYSYSILCMVYSTRSLTSKLNSPSAFLYFWWCGLGRCLKNLVLFTSLRTVLQ